MSIRPSLGLLVPPANGLGIYFTRLETLFVPLLMSGEPGAGMYCELKFGKKPGRFPRLPRFRRGGTSILYENQLLEP